MKTAAEQENAAVFFIAIFKNSAYQNGIFAIALFTAMILPPGRKSKHPAAGPKGGFELIFHIAVCSPDSVLRSRVERQCLDYYARRDDACIVEQLDGPEALLARDDAGERYELCRSVHAEANAIISAARRETLGATLYMACVEPDTGALIPGSTQAM